MMKNAEGIEMPELKKKDQIEKNENFKRNHAKVLKDIKLANAVKLGTGEILYAHEKHYEIKMHDNLIVSIQSKIRPGSTDKPDRVYTSIMNVISWRV